MKIHLKQLVPFLFGLMILSGCDQGGSLNPLSDNAVILAFGDSLTHGKGTSRDKSYPSVLSRLSQRKVINSGINGETTAEGMQRLGSELDEHQPDLLILLEGGNDILRNLDLAHTKLNLAAMIETAQARGIEVVLVGVPLKNLFSDVAPIYRELASEYKVVFVDDLVANLLRSGEYKSDLVHLNAAGYARMAELLHEILVDHGAL